MQGDDAQRRLRWLFRRKQAATAVATKEADDYLSVSEIASLKLDAGWVILSASTRRVPLMAGLLLSLAPMHRRNRRVARGSFTPGRSQDRA